jgi:hypothetical protein
MTAQQREEDKTGYKIDAAMNNSRWLISPYLQRKLAAAPEWLVSITIALCAFGVYFCMYGFRKPFTAAGYEGVTFLGISYKVLLVSSQVMGYMMSKFYGIRFISAMEPRRRASTIILLILIAWGALLLFAIVPPPFNIILLFINGMPLGVIWGLVFGYLEGRKTTEFMGVVLSTSFIFSSGVTKSVGKFLITDGGVHEMWMPFVTGLFFVVPLIVFTWLLNQVPPPTPADIALRSPRSPMTGEERRSFVKLFLPGLIAIVSTYVLLTALRDFRDDFSNEIWNELGYGNSAAIFTTSSIPISIIVLFSLSLLILVRNNLQAFMINHMIIVLGYMISLSFTLMFMFKRCDPVTWMIMIGTGLYLSYVPFNCLYFERMIASFRIKGNVGFVMYIADAFGYLGTVIILLLKEFLGLQISWTSFFIQSVLFITVFGMIGTIFSGLYYRRQNAVDVSPVTT